MPDILHRVELESSSARVTYDAMATIEGLSAWWMRDTEDEMVLRARIAFLT